MRFQCWSLYCTRNPPPGTLAEMLLCTILCLSDFKNNLSFELAGWCYCEICHFRMTASARYNRLPQFMPSIVCVRADRALSDFLHSVPPPFYIMSWCTWAIGNCQDSRNPSQGTSGIKCLIMVILLPHIYRVELISTYTWMCVRRLHERERNKVVKASTCSSLVWKAHFYLVPGILLVHLLVLSDVHRTLEDEDLPHTHLKQIQALEN